MPPSASTFNIDKLRASADLIEEVDGLITYFGFCEPGTLLTSEPKWSVMKVVQSAAAYPILTTFTWATGMCAYNLTWDGRAGYTYIFKTF